MPHKKFIFAYETGPLSYLITMPKALPIMVAHKIRDARFQLLLVKAACALLAALGAGICGLHLMPMFLAVGIAAHGVFLFAFVLWLGLGDIFLTFALEDERFYELATERNALDVFEERGFSLPQPRS
jgi:hypothetical protein